MVKDKKFSLSVKIGRVVYPHCLFVIVIEVLAITHEKFFK